MSDLENTIKRDLLLLERAIEGGHVEAYNIVEQCMSNDLRDVLGNAIYAYHANQAAKMDELEGNI